MKFARRTQLLVEPPSVATGDIAFNLIVFFLVCASVQPAGGRRQDIPKSESKQEKSQQSENIEVSLTRGAVAINGQPTLAAEFRDRLKRLLSAKSDPADRIVVVKSSGDTPYDRWIEFTTKIEEAGGVITLQVEDERTVATP